MFHSAAAAGVEVDEHADIGFAGLALDRGLPRAIDQAVGDRGPVFEPVAQPQAADAHVLRQLQIGLAVADHPAVGQVQFTGLQVIQHHADARFAGCGLLVLEVRVDVHRAEVDALRSEQVDHFLLRNLVVRRRKRVGAEAVLVADDDKFVAGRRQLQQGRDHAGDQFQLFQ